MSDVGHRGVGERIDYSCNLIRISGGGGGHYCLVSHRAGGDCGVSLPRVTCFVVCRVSYAYNCTHHTSVILIVFDNLWYWYQCFILCLTVPISYFTLIEIYHKLWYVATLFALHNPRLCNDWFSTRLSMQPGENVLSLSDWLPI